MDREKLMELLNDSFDEQYNKRGLLTARHTADHLVANGVVVPVHCKDCKHWADGVAGCTEHIKCCKIGYYMVGENGYCVYGERKQDEQNKL